MRRSRLIVLAVTWLLVTCSVSPSGAREASVSWSKLSYKISKLLISIQLEVEARIVPTWSVSGGWIETGEGEPVRPGSGSVLAVRLKTQGVGRRSTLDLWADPVDWAALQRLSTERGNRPKDFRFRGYRFLDLGVFSLTRYPRPGQAGRPPEEWSRVEEELLSVPTEQQGRFVDATTLFWIASTLDVTDPGASEELRLWLRRGLFQVELAARELTQLRVDYRAKTDAGEKRVRGLVPVRRFTLASRPLYTDAPQKNFRFAGLSGDIDVYVDVQNRVPLQISGSLRPLGRGHLKLKEVTLRD